MQYGRFGIPNKLWFIPLLLTLGLIVSCGAAAVEPRIVEKEVIVEREVIREVPVEKQVVVKEEVIREVIKEVPRDVESPKIVQGMLEGSNVQPILEMAKIIEISRTYDSVRKFIEREDERMRNMIKGMGQTA